MPRTGRKLTMNEVWSLLTSLTDEVVTINAQVSELKQAVDSTAQLVGGYVKANQDVDRWQAEHMGVLSSKVPVSLIDRFDQAIDRIDQNKWTRSSVIARFVSDFVERNHEDEESFQLWLKMAQIGTRHAYPPIPAHHDTPEDMARW